MDIPQDNASGPRLEPIAATEVNARDGEPELNVQSIRRNLWRMGIAGSLTGAVIGTGAVEIAFTLFHGR